MDFNSTQKVRAWIGFILLAFTLVFVATLLFIFSFYARSSITQQHDCVVVFGAAVWPGGNPSHALADRVDTAIDLYKRNAVSCLVFSGAQSAYGKHEVDVMLDIAFEQGVTLQDVEVDYHGENTQQTLRNLEKERSYILVSNDFHLPRISLLARKEGLTAFTVYPSVYARGRYTKELQFVLREVAALWFYAADL